MESNSNRPELPGLENPNKSVHPLSAIIEESKAAIGASEEKQAPKKRGRKSNAEKAAIAASVSTPELSEPKPAGVAPIIRPAFSLIGQAISDSHGVSDLEFPEDKAAMLAEQGDMVLGMFFPDIANSKWGALTAFSAAMCMIYFGHNSKAKTLAAQRKMALRKKEAENPAADNPLSSAMPGFGATIVN